MTSQVLATELAAIAQEVKRKHPDVRAAVEKSLQDLKALPNTSEQQLAADLARKNDFIDPFVLAVKTNNARLANSAVVCLQRLVVTKGLPQSKLHDVLVSLQALVTRGLDIQLKILQTLPALVQNYTADIKGQLIASTLEICSTLLEVRDATVSGVAAAIFQQVVVLVFDRVSTEDDAARKNDIPPVEGVTIGTNTIPVREAAFDAYRLLLDLCQAPEGQQSEFLSRGSITPRGGLDLVLALLNSHAALFSTHLEFEHVLQEMLVPGLIRLLSDLDSFDLTIRTMKMIPLLISRHARRMAPEFEILLNLLTRLLDPDSSPPWRRVMIMEVFKSIYATPGLVIQLYAQYDAQEGHKLIVKDNVSAFVRLSTEKPALLGLGPQSTVPSTFAAETNQAVDPASIDATGGVAALITSTTDVLQQSPTGLSSQHSIPKVPLLDMLEKTSPPNVPETYIYYLALECINSLSESLAKIILPLTMSRDQTPRKGRPQQNHSQPESEIDGNGTDDTAVKSPDQSRSSRSASGQAKPSSTAESSSSPKVQVIAGLVNECWPALLAVNSTFLYCTLDNDEYRNLIKSMQRYTQVAGLLALTVARDAFLTTLGKAAVPPNLLSSIVNSVPPTPTTSSPASFLQSKNFLNIGSALDRRLSVDTSSTNLTTRNLLCLRALINLAIALGPILGDSLSIILSTIQQADVYLDYIHQFGGNGALASLSHEIEAVDSASKRLLDSTADYPNEAFRPVAVTLCQSLRVGMDFAISSQTESPRKQSASELPPRGASGISAVQFDSTLEPRDQIIILSKLGRIVDTNGPRFARYPPGDTGWDTLVQSLLGLANDPDRLARSRLLATEIVCHASQALIQASHNAPDSTKESVQKLAWTSIQRLLEISSSDPGRAAHAALQISNATLATVKAVLEASGEDLLTGWDEVLSSIESSFEGTRDGDSGIPSMPASPTTSNGQSLSKDVVPSLRSPQTARTAFAILQLICADFLSKLDGRHLEAISQLLKRFSKQEDDLNIALTSITVFANISDFLLGQAAKSDLEQLAKATEQLSNTRIKDLSDRRNESRAVQWLILLDGLSLVAIDDRHDVRSGAIQTLLRILNEQTLSPPAFELITSALLLRLLELLALDWPSYQKVPEAMGHSLQEGTIASSTLLIKGVAEYLAANLETFEKTAGFLGTWERLITVFASFLDAESYLVSEAVFSGIVTMLAPVSHVTDEWSAVLGKIGSLWSRGIPKGSAIDKELASQQAAFLVYIGTAWGLVRLVGMQMNDAQIASIATNAATCIRESVAEKYGSDEMSMTKVQASVVSLLTALNQKSSAGLQKVIGVISTLIQLPFVTPKQEDITTKKLTFVALSKATMAVLLDVLRRYSDHSELFTSDTIIVALSALAAPIRIKYHWKKPGKAPPPWKLATTCVLDIVPLALDMIKSGQATVQQVPTQMWSSIVDVAGHITTGDYSPLKIPESYDDIAAVEDDEHFDAASLLTLRDNISPYLGDISIPDQVRKRYCHALFTASIIHPLQGSDAKLLDSGTDPLTTVRIKRYPSVDDPVVSRREDIGYLCLAELLNMASASPAAIPWHAGTTFPTPHRAVDYGAAHSAEKHNVAAAAAPWLLARLAVPIKSYVADQPLRGSLPASRSAVAELVWVLERMRDLRCHAACGEALAQVVPSGGAEGVVHLVALHALLVQAVGVAGSPRHGSGEVLEALMGCLDVLA